MDLQPAFVLNARPYRETSVLLELFTRDMGRVGAIARGARSKKSKRKALLQPFVPLLVEGVGKGELLTLKSVEHHGAPISLAGQVLPAAFYLNELLMRTLYRHDAHEVLFNAYLQALYGIGARHVPGTCLAPIEIILRKFEKCLLQEIGYGLMLDQEAESHRPIDPEQHYAFIPKTGFVLAEPLAETFAGTVLQAMHQDDYSDSAVLQAAKRLMRVALQPFLGNKPLHSRAMWRVNAS